MSTVDLFKFLLCAKFVRVSSFKRGLPAVTLYEGAGTVHVITESSEAIRTKESGFGRYASMQKAIPFSNILRWTRNDQNRYLLEHLRLGELLPVQLVEFCQKEQGEWFSRTPHQCGEDVYTATIYLFRSNLELMWHVIGPKKNDEIRFHYFDVL